MGNSGIESFGGLQREPERKLDSIFNDLNEIVHDVLAFKKSTQGRG